MQIHTTFRQMPSSQALRSYAESKITKLEKYYNGIIESRVTFAAGKTSQTAEVTIKAGGFTVRGEESASDAYAALDMVIDKLSRQLSKQHDKQKEHRALTEHEVGEAGEAEAVAGEDEPSSAQPQVTGRKTYSLRPIFTDDAVAQMMQSNEPFILFVNAETNSVNAIFRRPDGNFGLVEPGR